MVNQKLLLSSCLNVQNHRGVKKTKFLENLTPTIYTIIILVKIYNFIDLTFFFLCIAIKVKSLNSLIIEENIFLLFVSITHASSKIKLWDHIQYSS